MGEKPHQQIEHLSFTLAEAKAILKRLQQHLVEQQATAFVAAHAQCEHCGKALGITGYHTRTFRTLVGTVTLTSRRLYHCRCQRRKATTFRPLNALLTGSVAPERLLLETKWAPLVSYGLTAQALQDFLPVDTTFNAPPSRTTRSPWPNGAKTNWARNSGPLSRAARLLGPHAPSLMAP